MSKQHSFVCPKCHAEQHSLNVTCWLCGQPLPYKTIGEVPQTPMPVREPERLSFSLATMFLMITLASVCMGLLVALPGLGIIACIILVPVFFRTTRVVRHREAKGQEVSSAEKVSLFLGSFVVSSVLVIVVCVAAFCSFCGLCLTVVSLGDGADFLPIAIGICALGAGAIFLSVRMIKWNRQRYRRDIGEE